MVRSKNRLIDLYIHHRNLLNKGKGEIGWLNTTLSFIGIMLGLAYQDQIKDNFAIVIILGIGYMVVCYLVGWWWDHKRYYGRENDWVNERNPLTHEIRKAISSRREKSKHTK